MSAQEGQVVVIGAGLSGLTAARRLVEAGRQVTVVEARGRVGGRTLSQDLAGARFDLGGQWIGPGQRRLAALARELGVATFPTWHQGRKVLDLQGQISTYQGDIPSISPLHLLVLQAGLMRLERLSAHLESLEPEGARRLEGQTLAQLRRRLIPPRRVRGLFDVAARVIFGAEPEELSALYALSYLKAGGGLLNLAEIKGGAQQDRFVEGAQSLSLGLARRLEGRLMLEAPVRRLSQSADQVEVYTDRGVLHARRVILAIPPPLVARVHCDAPLSRGRRELSQRMFMGQTLKCMAVYRDAFWRQAGFSGEVVCTGGPVDVVFDNTSHDGAAPALLGFMVGRHGRAQAALSPEARRQGFLQALARYFGPQALEPVAYVEQDWAAEPWSLGCPVGNLAAGAFLESAPALRAVEGRLHFAGTESATEYTGYMEGALQAGERAAQEVLEATA